MNELFEPVSNIWSRDIEDEELKKGLDPYAEALHKLVSIGTHLINWELKDENLQAYDEIFVISTAFKRILELVDAIALQVNVGAVSTAVVHLRVLFELSVQFEHLLTTDTNSRCQQMLLTDWYRSVEMINKIPTDKQSPEEKSYLLTCLGLIHNPYLSKIKTEYERLRSAKNKGEIKWYNLFNSRLGNFSKLIDEKFAKYKSHYNAINKGFGNDAVHSTNLLRSNLSYDNGLPALIQMRNHIETLPVTGITFAIGKNCCEVIARRRTQNQQSKYAIAIMVCEKMHKEVAFPGLQKFKK